MDIELSAPLGRKAIRDAFRKILPGLDVPVIEDISDLPESWDLWIYLTEGSDEFPTALMTAVPFVEGCDEELWLRDVARALSDELGVRSLFDGTPYGPTDAPFWCLIWDGGVPYLADDSYEDSGADNEESDDGLIRIVKTLDLEQFPLRRPEELVACVDRSWKPTRSEGDA